MRKFICNLAVLLLATLSMKAVEVESYTYSPDVVQSSRYAVSVQGKPVTVLQTPEPDVAIFGADGEVTVKIQCLGFVPDTVTVRPIAKNYKYSLQGNEITLTLKTGDRVSVEPGRGDYNIEWRDNKPLFIFVNPLEKEAVAKARKNGNTVFYEAGKIHRVGLIPMSEGKNVYIQGGAIVEGYVDTRDAYSGYKLEGCGVLDGNLADGVTFPKKNAVRIENCNKLILRNLTIFNMDYWTTYVVHCDHTLLDNIKVVATFSHIANGTGCENDGIDICGSRDVLVKGCFAYCHDDAFCIKSSTPTCTRLSSKNYFEDCVAWNVDSGNSFEIGYRISGGVDDCHFKDIYAIHSGHRPKSNFRRSGLSIHAGSDGTLSNLTYENVWIEDPAEYTININVFKTPYKSYEWAPGKIENVKINNLHILKNAPLGGVIKGYDEDHLTQNIAFTNVWLCGEKVTDFQSGDIRDVKYSKNISFDGVVATAPAKSSYRIILMGDSTCATNSNTTGTSYRGWGQIFPFFFNGNNVEVKNFAKGGCSTKTFRSQGIWNKVITEVKEGDIVLVQFGHNDENRVDDRGTTPDEYKANLKAYITALREKKAQPVLLTPILRRRYDDKGKAMRGGGGSWNHLQNSPKVFELASEMNVPLIDGEKISEDWLNSMNREQAKNYFVWFHPGDYSDFADGKKDDTHLNQKGAYELASRFSTALCGVFPVLEKYRLATPYSKIEEQMGEIKIWIVQ